MTWTNVLQLCDNNINYNDNDDDDGIMIVWLHDNDCGTVVHSMFVFSGVSFPVLLVKLSKYFAYTVKETLFLWKTR